MTLGVAWSPADRLKRKYRGLEQLSATTRDSDLLAREADFGGFIAVTYGLAGGQKQFQGVFPGSK